MGYEAVELHTKVLAHTASSPILQIMSNMEQSVMDKQRVLAPVGRVWSVSRPHLSHRAAELANDKYHRWLIVLKISFYERTYTTRGAICRTQKHILGSIWMKLKTKSILKSPD
jgi:hypothetical protein